MNVNPSGTTITQVSQHEAPPNTQIPGPVAAGIKRPFSAISNPPFPNHEPTMTSDNSPTSTKQCNEAMKDDIQRHTGSTTSPGPYAQVSTRTNTGITGPTAGSSLETSVMTRRATTTNTGMNVAMQNDTQHTTGSSTSPAPLSKVSTVVDATNESPNSSRNQKTSNGVKHPAARLVNAPLSRASLGGNSFSEISSIESTPKTPTLSGCDTPNSGAMSTPNSNGDITQGSTTQSSNTQSGTTQGTITQNITKSKSSTMTDSSSTEPPTYAQVTAASGPRSMTTTTPVTPIYPSLGVSQPQPRFHTPLSLANTSTNRPSGLNFTPLRPIHNWIPPRPAIISRTERSAAGIAEDIADEEARNAEKKAEAERKEKEMEVLREAAERAEKAAEVERARALGERVAEWRDGGRGSGRGRK